MLALFFSNIFFLSILVFRNLIVLSSYHSALIYSASAVCFLQLTFLILILFSFLYVPTSFLFIYSLYKVIPSLVLYIYFFTIAFYLYFCLSSLFLLEHFLVHFPVFPAVCYTIHFRSLSQYTPSSICILL